MHPSWILHPFWVAHAGEQSGWKYQEWKGWCMLPCQRTLKALWCWLVWAGHVQHQPSLDLGGLQIHHRGIQRILTLGPWLVSSWGWTLSHTSGQLPWALIGGHHFSASVWPWTVMSSAIPMQSSHSSSIWSILFWKTSQVHARPKGRHKKWCRPYGVLKVVSKLDLESRMTAQHLCLASNFVKYLEWARLLRPGLLVHLQGWWH